MPILNEELRRRLVAKYGTNVNLDTSSRAVSALLKELAADLLADPIGEAAAGYQKTYTEGYNREGYSRADYTRYDRTDGSIYEDLFDDLMTQIRPELDKLIVEKLRKAPKGNR